MKKMSMTKAEMAVIRAALRWHRSGQKALRISNQIYWGSLVSATTMLTNACARLVTRRAKERK